MRQVKIQVIMNAGAGAGNKAALRQRINDALGIKGNKVQIALAQTGAEVNELAQRAAQSDIETVVAAGGDGTVNSVAAAVVDSTKALGILPLGTMNHFAKDLHIPLNLDGAAETIVTGHQARVDVGEVNDRIFLNNSSLGLYPNIVREREKQQRLGFGKWPAFIWAAVSVLRRYPFLDIRLNADGKQLTSRTPFLFVGNNEYEMETLNVGGRACLDAGELSLYMTNRTGRLGLIRLAWRALFGGLHQEKDFLALHTKEIWIGSKHRRLRVALDGEVTIMETPLHYRVRTRALRVMVPVEPRQTP